jgi:hypothetical protein
MIYLPLAFYVVEPEHRLHRRTGWKQPSALECLKHPIRSPGMECMSSSGRHG